jgi:hypothetical protein
MPAKAAKKKTSRPKQPKLWSTSQVAEQLQISTAQARNLLGMVPVAKRTPRGDKFYKIEDVKTALTNTRQSGNHAEEGSREWYEVEKLKRQVDKLDHELDTIKAKVIPIDEVRAQVMKLALEFRKTLDEMESKLPPMVSGMEPQDIQSIIKDYNRALRQTLRESHAEAR